MGINRITLKRNSKQLLRTSNPNPLIMGLIYFIISYILSNLSTRLTGVQVNIQEYTNALQTMDLAFFQNIIKDYDPSAGAILIDIAIRILQILLHTGFMIFVLNTLYKREGASSYNLLDRFAITGRVLVLYLLTAIYVFLWSLLFIIPGIIALYRYRMALFLLLEHPELTPAQCIEESKRMMNGHKSELFSLDLSFLGWLILSVIPFVSAYVTPYMQLTYAGFYDSLKRMQYSGEHDYTGYDAPGPDVF